MLTHGYAPTEQYTTTSRKGSYTDIYAIGATLYFILTGKVPMEAAARITEHMPEPRELRPDLPEEANRTIMKAMQLKSSDRHQTVKEFMDDLRNIHPSEPGPTQATEAPKPPKQTVQAKTEAAPKAQQTVASSDVKPAGTKKNKGLIWGLVAALVVVVAVVVVMLVGGGDKETTSAAANAQTQYKEMAARCMSQISLGGTSNTQELLNAKALLDSIRSMEAQYGAEIPDVYNRSNELNAAIEPKLKQAAADWAEEGDNLMNEFKDYPKAIENYTLSLQLKEDPAVREKLEYAKNQK
jgi:serine/threonine protein kinase